MPVADDEFRTLMGAMQAGSREAADRFCRDYQAHILRVVRRRLMRRLRVRYDSLDLVHDVWLSFFSRPPRDRRFLTPNALIVYLEHMTRNKVIETARHAWSRKTSPAREEASAIHEELAQHHQPSPSQLLMVEEEFDRLTTALPPYQRRIVSLLRLGLSNAEIAQRLQTNPKTVQRLIRRITREAVTHE
jgi:RNA polymerase sigma factor (sigma-70 family)